MSQWRQLVELDPVELRAVQYHRRIVPALPLACTVRGCGLPLEHRDRRFECAKRHTFDTARSGYLNLLQPQDRRSANAGDSREAVEARASLLAAGIGRALIDDLTARAASLALPVDAVAVDLGSGGGDALAALAARRALAGIGIDLSTAAAERAARAFPECAWVVANADRRLPLLDQSVHVVLSLHGRRNPDECARVLAPGGVLLMAVPAPDDLIELRTLVQGKGLQRDRTAGLTAAHDQWFALEDRATVRERPRLKRDALVDLLRGTYRGARAASADRVQAVSSMDVTIASDILLFSRR